LIGRIFPPASDFSIVVTDLKVSTDSMSSSTVGFDPMMDII